MPAAGVRPESCSAFEDRLDLLPRYGLASQDFSVYAILGIEQTQGGFRCCFSRRVSAAMFSRVYLESRQETFVARMTPPIRKVPPVVAPPAAGQHSQKQQRYPKPGMSSY